MYSFYCQVIVLSQLTETDFYKGDLLIVDCSFIFIASQTSASIQPSSTGEHYLNIF
jgi:hypothetical protein